VQIQRSSHRSGWPFWEEWSLSHSLDGASRHTRHTQPAITFQPVPEPKRGKTRIHFDLVVDDLEHSQEKVIGLGGCSLNQRHDYAEGIVVVMADQKATSFALSGTSTDHPATAAAAQEEPS